MTNHIVIAGTGRAGTSFLVHLLTELGYDTGYKPGEIQLHPVSRAGLEHNMRTAEELPYIVKDPLFSMYCEQIFEEKKFNVKHVIIPIRNLKDAAESRIKIQKINNEIDPYKPMHGGGLYGTSEPYLQAATLAIAVYKLIDACTKYEVPMIFISYPRMMRESNYLFYELSKNGIIPKTLSTEFDRMHAKIVNPDWIK